MNVSKPIYATHQSDSSYNYALAERVKRALENGYIELNASQDYVAKTLFMSTRTLNRRLHDEGTSLKTIITEVRLEQSRILLMTTTLSVQVIGKMLGLSGGGPLAQIFIRKTGESPSQYRNSTETHLVSQS